MYEQIFGKVGVFLSRDVLAKGFLPAAVLLLLVCSIALGPQEVVAAMARAIGSPLEKVEQILCAVLVLLMVSALFVVFSTKSFALLDGSLLPSRLRAWLRGRSVRRRWHLQWEVDEHEARLTLLKWISTMDLQTRPFISPPELRVPQSVALGRLTHASNLLQSIDARNSATPEFRFRLDPWQQRALAQGLGALRQLHADAAAANDVNSSVRVWALLRRPHNQETVRELKSAIEHDWSRAKVVLSSQYSGSTIEPTRLSNVLEALDHYGETRYGIPTSVIWRRIWWLLTETERESVGASRLSVDTGVNLTIALALSGITAAGYIAARWWRPDLFASHTRASDLTTVAFISVGSTFVAFVSYRATVAAVATLSDKVSALLDLRRLDVLRKLGFKPSSAQLEKTVLKELRVFLAQGSPLGPASTAAYVAVAESSADGDDTG